MKWIVAILVIIIAWVLVRFLWDLSKQTRVIESQGGIKTVYKQLIDGLLKYPNAEIIQDKKHFVTIGGVFFDPISSRTCGQWSVIIQPAFKILTVKYQAHIDLEGGKYAKQMWDFPININQNEVLSIIRKKVDEWDTYGVVK